MSPTLSIVWRNFICYRLRTAELLGEPHLRIVLSVVLLAAGRVVEGDTVIIVAGSPPGIPGSTNALRVHRVGDAKNRVAPAYSAL